MDQKPGEIRDREMPGGCSKTPGPLYRDGSQGCSWTLERFQTIQSQRHCPVTIKSDVVDRDSLATGTSSGGSCWDEVHGRHCCGESTRVSRTNQVALVPTARSCWTGARPSTLWFYHSVDGGEVKGFGISFQYGRYLNGNWSTRINHLRTSVRSLIWRCKN